MPASNISDEVKNLVHTALTDRRLLVLGVGHRLRGDDAFGSLLAEKLSEDLGSRPALKVIDCGTTPENNFAPAEEFQPDLTLFVDALQTDAPPGEVELIDPDEVALSGFTTHTYSPAVFIERLLERAGGELKLLGVSPARTSPGLGLSEACEQTLTELVELFRTAVNSASG